MSSPTQLSDDAWRDALSRQARENSRLFYKLAFGVLRDGAAAEDACQQALLAAWDNRQTLIDPAALKGWLCRCVVNTSLQNMRRRKSELTANQRRAESAPTDSLPDQSWEQHEVLMASLAEVPEVERCVVVLRVMEGLSGREVAELCDCSTAEVSRRLRRGMEQLRRYFSRRQLMETNLP